MGTTELAYQGPRGLVASAHDHWSPRHHLQYPGRPGADVFPRRSGVQTRGCRRRLAYGRCTWKGADLPPVITVRCTVDGDRTRWRRIGAIVGTLLHEIAHLRYRSHGPRFWALHRRLVDRAVALGAYDPTDRDPSERGRGDEKLAASAAWSIALAARQARL